MSVIIPLHGRCGACGKPGRPLVFVAGQVHEKAVTCDQCFERAMAVMLEERKIFDGLLALGVSRGTANVMMIAKHDHERAVPKEGTSE